MHLGLRYDDNVHRKLKVIAAYREQSLNTLIMSLFDKEIAEWEKEHGEIKFPNS